VNYDIYGRRYHVDCHDHEGRDGVQFRLRDPSGERGRE
jgi:hypothetical protein